MSMLTEKRQEIVNKINALMLKQETEIQTKVKAYEAQLRAQPIYGEEFCKLHDMIDALDKVIAFEECEAMTPVIEPVPTTTVEHVIEPAIVNTEVVDTVIETIVGDSAEARPGMTTIVTPERS